MLTRLKCWDPAAASRAGTQNRSSIQLRDHDGSRFFFHPALGPSQRPEPSALVAAALDGQRNGQGFATLGDTKAARIFGDPLTGGMGFSGAADACRSRPAGCCVGAPPPDGNGNPDSRSAAETVRDPKVQQGNSTHVLGRNQQRPVSDASKAERGSTGGQRWKVKAVEFTGSG
jgi:hypothetical protein